MFYSILRANDTEEVTQARQYADAEAHRIAYQNEATEEKLAKQEANTEARRKARQNEKPVEKLYKKKADTEAHRSARENEQEEHHQSRNAKGCQSKKDKSKQKVNINLSNL